MRCDGFLLVIIFGFSAGACAKGDSPGGSSVAVREARNFELDIENLEPSRRYHVPLSGREKGYFVLRAGGLLLKTKRGQVIEIPVLPGSSREGAPTILVRDVNKDRLPDFFIKISENSSGACYSLLVQSQGVALRYIKHADEFCNPAIDSGRGTVTSIERHGPFASMAYYQTSGAGEFFLSSREDVIDFDYSRYVVGNAQGKILKNKIIFRGLPQCGSAYARIKVGGKLHERPDESSRIAPGSPAGEMAEILEITPNESHWAKIRLASAGGSAGWMSREMLEIDEAYLQSACPDTQ